MADYERNKIFRRNLTARAFHMIDGNAVITRPESATDVCTPGLEIDLRTLEEHFFPGFVWEFEGGPGVRLRDMDAEVLGLKREECVAPAPQVFLWAMHGHVHQEGAGPLHDGMDGPQHYCFGNAQARLAWRRVRDLVKGRVAILIGATLEAFEGFDAAKIHRLLEKAMEPDSCPHIVRNGGKFEFAVLAANRLEYTDKNSGVISDVFQPGELTKGLCSPWQLDFRVCGCRFWAASKPDIVSGDEPGTYFNYNRNRDRFAHELDTADLDARDKQRYTVEEMLSGEWRKFPAVIGGKEVTADQSAPEAASPSEVFTPQEAAAELCYLATVEHALLVQYLYAAYSVRRIAPPDATEGQKLDFAKWNQAAGAVTSIAQDEMRHFMWVNQLLVLLGYAPSMGRARVIGADPARVKKGPCCRKRMSMDYSHQLFRLTPLTRKALDRFIAVEKNSQTLDGMYTRLYESIRRAPGSFPNSGKLLPLLKLIIDEGQDHFARFTRVRTLLDTSAGEDWLITTPQPSSMSAESTNLQFLAANYYAVLIDILRGAFQQERGGAALLKLAREVMTRLDSVIIKLADYGVLFDWPEPGASPAYDANGLSEASRAEYGKVLQFAAEADVAMKAESRLSALAGAAPRLLPCTHCEYDESEG